MATSSYGNPGAVTDVNTSIASIADGGKLNVGTINNVGGDVYADFELEVQFSTAPSLNGVIEVYFLKRIESAEFETGDGGTESVTAMQRVREFTVADVTSLQRLILDSVVLPNAEFEIVLVNETGQATDASASLKYRTFNMEAT